MMSFNRAMIIMAFFMATLLSSCSYFIDMMGDPSYDVVDINEDSFGIYFSHNVNGETHPCGCRHFPLGGLAQVAGLFAAQEKKEPMVYVDSGDTLFASASLPKTLDKSKSFNALGLAKHLSEVGLRYWTPGDQDFAKGLEFLKRVTVETKINILLSNLKDSKTLPHKELVTFEKGPHKIFMLGFINPNVLASQYKELFLSYEEAMKKSLVTLKEKGYDSNNKFHRLVIMSHAGMGPDEKLARDFPIIDWIIGAHTMNFLRFANEEGKTKIVQVLSRNHYMGHISFSMKGDKSKDSYQIHEIRDELKDELKPNPFLAKIDKHKEELAKVQKIEQSEMSSEELGKIRYATASSCVECHQKQADFWQGTAHSIAYYTLLTAKEENNLACVKCHSLGLDETKGFQKVSDILEFDEPHYGYFRETPKNEVTEKYWSELKDAFGPVKSVRDLASSKRKKLSNIWFKHDSTYKVNRNFANVQCLNCHSQHDNHPFEQMDPPMPKESKMALMTQKCLTCHDSDQSPQWYQKQDNGLPGAVDQEKLGTMIKKVACPASEE